MEFLKANAGKVAVVGVILAAAAFLAWWNAGTADPLRGLPDEIRFVDVSSGELYSFSRGEPFALPRENPDTGERTLLPVVEKEGGLFVSQRRASVLSTLGEKNRWVDPETLRV